MREALAVHQIVETTISPHPFTKIRTAMIVLVESQQQLARAATMNLYSQVRLPPEAGVTGTPLTLSLLQPYLKGLHLHHQRRHHHHHHHR